LAGSARPAHRSLVILGVVLLAVATIAAACSTDDTNSSATTTDPQATEATPPTTADSTSSSTSPPATDQPASALDAIGAAEAALAVTPGAVIDVGQGNEGGQAVWEVTVRDDDGNGIEHYIAVATGEALRTERYQLPSVAESAPAVSIQDAMTTALDAVPDSAVIEADLGTNGQRVVWEVLVRRNGAGGVELYLDAATGEVVKQEAAD